MVHCSMVLPHMDYASIVWGRCTNMVNTDRMSKLQKSAEIVMLRCRIIDISSKHLFNTMNWMTFYDRVTYKRCLMIYKVNTNLVPQYLQSVTCTHNISSHS